MPPSKPVLLAVDDDLSALSRVTRELLRYWAIDFEVATGRCVADGRTTLERLREEGRAVAVALVDQWLPDGTGTDLLAAVHDLHPDARRGLLVEWGAWGERKTADAILHGMARGAIDYYVLKPTRSPDWYFHRTTAEFVHEWSRAAGGPDEIVVTGERWEPRAHELRNLLQRNGVPHRFVERPDAAPPEVRMPTGRVLVDPTNAELASAYGMATGVEDGEEVDVLVVGAGPAGLSAAVYAASEGLSVLVVEGESIGGQAGTSSLIRNYLGFARGVAGAELAQRAYQQAWVFGARFVLMQRVTALRRAGERHVATLGDGTEVGAAAVVLATGVTYRSLGVPALDELGGAGVYHGASVTEAAAVAGGHAFVVGGGNSAGQAALHLARHAARVSLVVRRASLTETMSQYLIDQIDAAPNVDVLGRTEVVDGGGEGRLERLTLRDRDTGATRTVAAAGLFVLIGAEPRTGWLPEAVERDRWGYVLTGAGAREGATMHETSLPGVYAVGDVRAGSIKRVASAVGEGSVVIRQVHERLARDEEVART